MVSNKKHIIVLFLPIWTFSVKSTIHNFQARVQNLVQGFNILHGYYRRIQDFREQIQRDGTFSKGLRLGLPIEVDNIWILKGDGPFLLPKVYRVTLPETNIALPETNSSNLEMHGYRWKVRSFPFGFWLASVFFPLILTRVTFGLQTPHALNIRHNCGRTGSRKISSMIQSSVSARPGKRASTASSQ